MYKLRIQIVDNILTSWHKLYHQRKHDEIIISILLNRRVMLMKRFMNRVRNFLPNWINDIKWINETDMDVY